MNFDVQTFLSEMRREHTEALRDLKTEMVSGQERILNQVDKIQRDVYSHETRLVVVENTRKTVRWLSGAFITTLIGSFITFVISLFKR